jgi:DNA-binding CsgD family transcriptional regulator
MVGFTALFVSLAIAFLCYQRTPFKWLKSYLVLLATQAIFDLSYTFVLFTDIYSGAVTEEGHPIFNVLRVVVSLILLYVGPRVVQLLLGTARKRYSRVLTLAPALLLTASYLLRFVFDVYEYDIPATVVYYAYLALWYLRGLLQSDRLPSGTWRPWIIAFLAGATAWHALAAVELLFGPVLLSEDPAIHMVVLSSSIFSLYWAASVVVPASRCLTEPAGPEGEGVPEVFVREFDLSRREAEVLEQLCLGLSNRDIGEKLYISPRTVENHVYNLYRKCGVSRRMELCNLLNQYR